MKLRRLARVAPERLAAVEYLVDLMLKSVLVFVLLSGACTDTPAPAPSPLPPTTSTLRGTVTSRDGTLGHVSIEIMDGADRTRAVGTLPDGTYTFPGLTHGTFSVRASLTGYVREEQRVTLRADAVQDFRLTRANVWTTGDAPTITLLPSHQYQFSGTLQNTGDACASGLRGTLEVVLGSGRFSLPLVTATTLDVSATTPYTACCVDERDGAGQLGTATPKLTYDSVNCG